MKIPTVEKFLFCLKLETGARILGWIFGILAALGFLVSNFIFGFAAVNYEGLLNATAQENQASVELLQKSKFSERNYINERNEFLNFLLQLFSRHCHFVLNGCVFRIFPICEHFTDKRHKTGDIFSVKR